MAATPCECSGWIRLPNLLDLMEPERLLKQAFLADCRLPAHRSWWTHLSTQLRPYLESTPTEEGPTLQTFSLRTANSAHEQQLQTDASSRTLVYRELKSGYQLEAYIQQCSNQHLRRITAQFRTGSHWLNVETGRHKQPQVPRDDRVCHTQIGAHAELVTNQKLLQWKVPQRRRAQINK